MTDIDYLSVDIPDDVPPNEYHYTQRRAALLRTIKRAGTPAVVNRREAGARFGVSHTQIQKDLDVLAEYAAEKMGGERAKLTANSTFDAAVSELLNEDEYYKAAKTAGLWMDWLQDIGEQESEPDRHEIDARVDANVREAGYQVVEHIDEETPRVTVDGSDQESVEFAATPSKATETDTDTDT